MFGEIVCYVLCENDGVSPASVGCDRPAIVVSPQSFIVFLEARDMGGALFCRVHNVPHDDGGAPASWRRITPTVKEEF
jgi:hypothetical protein